MILSWKLRFQKKEKMSWVCAATTRSMMKNKCWTSLTDRIDFAEGDGIYLGKDHQINRNDAFDQLKKIFRDRPLNFQTQRKIELEEKKLQLEAEITYFIRHFHLFFFGKSQF